MRRIWLWLIAICTAAFCGFQIYYAVNSADGGANPGLTARSTGGIAPPAPSAPANPEAFSPELLIDSYIEIGEHQYVLDSGVITTERQDDGYKSSVVLIDVYLNAYHKDAHVLKLWISHSSPGFAGEYVNPAKTGQCGFSGRMIFSPLPFYDGETWEFTDGSLEIKREEGEYAITMSCKGVSTSESEDSGQEPVPIALHYSGPLNEVK